MTATSTHEEPTQSSLGRPEASTVEDSPEPFGPARLDRDELQALAGACGAPRVSLFWPVGPLSGDGPPQARLAMLVREAEDELARGRVAPDVAAAILTRIHSLSTSLGQPRSGSLALLAEASEAWIFALPQTVEPHAFVAGRYRVSPLVTLVEDDRLGELAAQRRLAASLDSGRVRLDLPTALVKARAGRLELLLVALGSHAWGTFDAEGHVELHPARRTGDEELVDLAVAYALGHGTEVHVSRGDRIPGIAGEGMVAALIEP